MIGFENSPKSGHGVWPRALGSVVMALALTACGGESLEAQVAAAAAEGDFTKVIGLWDPLAADGDVHAMLEIAALYESGPASIQDYSKAAETYRQAADLGDSAAMISLGMLYENALGVDRDMDEALALYTQAGDLGDVIGQFRVGLLYDGGTWGPPDYQAAIRWYKKAAIQGFVDAQMKLGGRFFSGFGETVVRDTTEAAKWFRMAAELGHPGGQLRMGMLHEAGTGVEKNPEIAYAWFRLAAAQGSETADQSLTRVVLTLDPDTLASAQALSRAYWDLYVAPFQGI